MQNQKQVSKQDAEIQLRGYEVAKWNPLSNSWDQVGAYRPNNWGLNDATKSAAFLNDRHPNAAYTVRPVISFSPGLLPMSKLPDEDGPLHLDSDQEQLGFDFSDEAKAAAPIDHAGPAHAPGHE